MSTANRASPSVRSTGTVADSISFHLSRQNLLEEKRFLFTFFWPPPFSQVFLSFLMTLDFRIPGRNIKSISLLKANKF